MSLILIEGFDDLDTTSLLKKYAGAGSTVENDGRNSSKFSRLAILSNGSGAVYLPVPSITSVVLGFAVRLSTISVQTHLISLCAGSAQLDLTVEAGGTLRIYKNTLSPIYGNVAVGSASTSTLLPNTWYYIEWKVTEFVNSCTSDSCIVRVNGNIEINLPAGTDTYNGTYTYGQYITSIVIGRLTSASGAINIDLDDIYIGDTTDSFDFLGDSRVLYLPPTGDGVTSQFTGSDSNSVDNYALVDEVAPDSADYLEGSTGQTQLLSFDNLPVSPTTIHGLRLSNYCAKTDAGALSAYPIVRSGGSNYDHSVQIYPSVPDYIFQDRIWQKNPDGDVAWTESAINALEAGVRL